MDRGGAEMKKYKLNKEKFTNFICGVAAALIIEGIWIAFLLKL